MNNIQVKEPKEAGAFKVLALSDSVSIAHDDKLLFRAQKHVIGLDRGWRDTVDVRSRDGEIQIVNWYDRTEGKAVSCDFIDSLEEIDLSRYRPQCLRGLDLGSGASVDLLNNQVDMYLLDLFNDSGSRYKSALEAVLDLADRGTLRYAPRAEETPRNRREAMRNRLKRYFKPTEYEHDILIGGALGKAIHDDLRASSKVAHLEDNTVYVRGYHKYDGLRYSVKAYDIDRREGKASTNRIKIETTLYKEFFKAEGIAVAEMTFQPDIQERILEELEKSLSYTVSLLSWGVKIMLAEALRVETRDSRKIDRAIASAMLRPERTLTERVAALERDMQAVKKRLDHAGL